MPWLRNASGGTDAGEHQQLRRVVRTARKDHFALGGGSDLAAIAQKSTPAPAVARCVSAVSARVTTVRFLRCIAGFRKARSVE